MNSYFPQNMVTFSTFYVRNGMSLCCNREIANITQYVAARAFTQLRLMAERPHWQTPTSDVTIPLGGHGIHGNEQCMSNGCN